MKQIINWFKQDWNWNTHNGKEKLIILWFLLSLIVLFCSGNNIGTGVLALISAAIAFYQMKQNDIHPNED